MKKILFVLLLTITNAHAFNWDKCDRFLGKASGLYGGVASTSSFITSTGDCSMIGMASHDKKVFIAHNLDHLQSDSARGDGEYLSAYATLSGCNEIGYERLKNALQANFSEIYGQDVVDHSPKKAYERIEKLILSDSVLKNSCSLRT